VPGDQAAGWYLARLDGAIEALADRGHGVAALVLDTVLSSEGIPTVPDGFLPAAAERVRAAGGLFVADEVQAGFGRTGDAFCGYQRLGAAPDLVTFGKPMGNGYPVSAVAARADLLERFAREHHYFNTFGGSPVAAAAALAVLDVMDRDALQENARIMGERLRTGLRRLAERQPCIGDVRGPGLFVAVDLVEDRETRAPATSLAHRVVNDLRRRGVLVGRTGPDNNVIKVRPPLVIDEQQVDLLLNAMAKALRAAT
jgi:4-aminobutyrate aminotransferase-like enzyme